VPHTPLTGAAFFGAATQALLSQRVIQAAPQKQWSRASRLRVVVVDGRRPPPSPGLELVPGE
jgi:hypothetical protein